MARNKEQNEKMREERLAQIKTAALKIFSDKGYFAAKIKDIANEVNMAQGLVYHYYKSKDEIYYDVIENAFNKMNEAVSKLKAMDLPSHEKIKAALIELVKTINTSDSFNQTVRIITSASNSVAIPENVKELLAEKRDMPYQIISEIIAAGQKEGTIVDGNPYELSVLFWTFINGLSIYKSTREEIISLPSPEILFQTFLKVK